MLRSCYATRMRFDATQPTRSSPVTWYFAAPGALAFPAAHSFGSANWIKGQGLPDGPVGELQAAPRPWRNGNRPVEATGQVCTFPSGEFVAGAPYLAGPRLEWPDGFPRQCTDGFSGIYVDLSHAGSPEFLPSCYTGPNPVYNTITVTPFNCSGACCAFWAGQIGVPIVLSRDHPFQLSWTGFGTGGQRFHIYYDPAGPSGCGFYSTIDNSTSNPSNYLGTHLFIGAFNFVSCSTGGTMGWNVTSFT